MSDHISSSKQDLGCTAFDQLDGPVAVNTSGLPINTHIIRNYTITYTACDSQAPPNCASLARTVIVVQTVVPVLTLSGLSVVRCIATSDAGLGFSESGFETSSL